MMKKKYRIMSFRDCLLSIFTDSRYITMDIFWNLNREPMFDLTTRDSYFTILVEVFTNHISAENIFHESYRVNRTQDYEFQPANRCQIIWQSRLLMISIIIHFLAKQKFCKHHFLRSRI